jgi:hypothetical protein
MAEAGAHAEAAHAGAAAAAAFDPSKPFDPSAINYKSLTYSKVAFQKNRLIIQRKYKCENDETCPICIDGMLGKSVIYTPCKHKFHTNCFYTMLAVSANHTCPLCRRDLLSSLINAFGVQTIITIINETIGNETIGNETIEIQEFIVDDDMDDDDVEFIVDDDLDY